MKLERRAPSRRPAASAEGEAQPPPARRAGALPRRLARSRCAPELNGQILVRAILDAALDAIVVVDADGRILEFGHSAERMFGIRGAAARGRRLDELIIPERFRERHRQGLARAVAGGDAPFVGRRLELSALRADGGEFPAEVTVTRLEVAGPPSSSASSAT